MDEKDRQILRVLQKEGRITNQELSETVNLSPSPCLRRLRALEDAGVIEGYSANVDAKAYGLTLMVYVRIRLERHSREVIANFEKHVQRIDEVLECQLMTGQADYLLRVVVAGLDAYENFVRTKLHPIDGIASIDSSFVYGTIKRINVFPSLI